MRRLELERHDDLIGARPRHCRLARRSPALPRLHARQARPLLRQVRPAALRRGVRAGRGRLGLAVDARRRRPLRGQPRRPARRASTTGASSRRRPGRCSRPRSTAASTCRTTAGARATASPRRRPSAASGRRPGYSGSSTCESSRSSATATAGVRRSRPAATAYDVDVHRELGEATHLTCSTAQLKRPTHYVAGTPRARAA